MTPPPDLDGDGQPDIVWVTFNLSAMVAVSAKSGKLLWCSAIPSLNTGLDLLTVDVNDDGIPDLIAPIGDYRGLGMVAVSGRDGHVLWRSERTVAANAARPSLFAAAIRLNGNRQRIEYTSNQVLATLDLRTGKRIGHDRDLGEPIHDTTRQRAPQYVELEGKGEPDTVLVEVDHGGSMVVEAIALEDRAVRWRKQTGAGGRARPGAGRCRSHW